MKVRMSHNLTILQSLWAGCAIKVAVWLNHKKCFFFASQIKVFHSFAAEERKRQNACSLSLRNSRASCPVNQY